MKYRKYNVNSDGYTRSIILYPIIFNNNSNLELELLEITEEGKFYLKDKLFDISDLEKMAQNGIIAFKIKNGNFLHVPNYISIISKECFSIIQSASDFIRELLDIVNLLNGKPTSSEMCLQAYQTYLQDMSQANLEKLRNLYDNVPEQLKCWLFGFPLKDIPIREILLKSK